MLYMEIHAQEPSSTYKSTTDVQREVSIVYNCPGGSSSTPWYGVVPFLGYLFHQKFRIYGYPFREISGFGYLYNVITLFLFVNHT